MEVCTLVQYNFYVCVGKIKNITLYSTVCFTFL